MSYILVLFKFYILSTVFRKSFQQKVR